MAHMTNFYVKFSICNSNIKRLTDILLLLQFSFLFLEIARYLFHITFPYNNNRRFKNTNKNLKASQKVYNLYNRRLKIFYNLMMLKCVTWYKKLYQSINRSKEQKVNLCYVKVIITHISTVKGYLKTTPKGSTKLTSKIVHLWNQSQKHLALVLNSLQSINNLQSSIDNKKVKHCKIYF